MDEPPEGVARDKDCLMLIISNVRRHRRGTISLALALSVATGCSRTPLQAPSSEGAPPARLEFLHDFNAPRSGSGDVGAAEARWGAAGIGGLSGLSFDAGTGTLHAVSDDCKRAPPRIYAFDVALSQAELRVAPRSVLLMRDTRGGNLLDFCDSESVAPDAEGGFSIGTENHDDEPGLRWPSILRVTREGLITGTLPLPEAFLPEAEGVPTRGTRTNLAFEGLSLSPSGRWLTAITESALRQDGPMASFTAGTTVRLLRWDRSGPASPTEYRYQTEPVPRPPSGAASVQHNGVAELLSLDDQRLLVLERAWVVPEQGTGKNTVRIFEISLGAPATSEAVPLLVSKRLVLDLDDILGQLEPGQQTLDNLEGMTFGPRLPSGERSLLLVSDDNFSATQRTMFLAFRIVE
jgi:hypothetical protein